MKTLEDIQIGLKKEIPFKWRVQSFSKFKPEATCVAYIDSRDVQDILDANCLWSDRYYEQGGLLFCEITIYADGREYKRADTGSETKVEKDKGHSSDAFKRAAVKFGVGRFLYSKKIQRVKADVIKTNSNYPKVIDDQGKNVWDLTKHINRGVKPIKRITPPIKKEPINIDRIKTRLEACVSEDELKFTFKSLTPTEQKAVSTITTAIKEKLTKKSA